MNIESEITATYFDCLHCGKSTEHKNKNKPRKFCSYECYWEHKKTTTWKEDDSRRAGNTNCLWCKKEIPATRKAKPKKYCNRECRQKYELVNKPRHRGTAEIKCYVCGVVFKRRIALIEATEKNKGRKNKFNFCSNSCIQKHNSGNQCIWRKQDQSGPSNNGWKGGVSPLRPRIENTKEYKEFRKKVLWRDAYKCRICGVKTNLELHHIIPFHANMELFREPSNGITLCKSCHATTKSKEMEHVQRFTNLVLNSTPYTLKTKTGQQ